jgi:hypothetical protein
VSFLPTITSMVAPTPACCTCTGAPAGIDAALVAAGLAAADVAEASGWIRGAGMMAFAVLPKDWGLMLAACHAISATPAAAA